MAKLHASGSKWKIKSHWGTESGKSDGWIPTEEDDVIFDKNSESMVLNGDIVCRNFYTESDCKTDIDFSSCNIDIKGQFSNASSKKIIFGDSKIQIGGNLSSINGTIDASNHSPEITVNNVLFDKKAGDSKLILGSSVWNVSGAFNISAIKSISTDDATICMRGNGRTIITGGNPLPTLKIDSAGSIILVDETVIENDLLVSRGVFDLNGISVSIRGMMDIDGTLKLKGNEEIKVDGEIDTEGSTVYYYNHAVEATVTDFPSKTFHNLLLGAKKIHKFAAGEENMIHINGIISSEGLNKTPSILRGFGETEDQWFIKLNGTSELKDNVDVSCSDARKGEKIKAVDSVNSGRTAGWSFSLDSESEIQSDIIKILPVKISKDLSDLNTALNPFKGIFNKELADGSGICNDRSNNVYISDTQSHVIWCIRDGQNPTIFAGQVNNAGMENGPAAQALFNKPKDITCDGSGNLYVFDAGNHRIRKVDNNGNVSTVSGVNPEIKQLSISVSTDDKIYAIGR